MKVWHLIRILVLLTIALLLAPFPTASAWAGVLEIAGTVSLSQNTYGDSSFVFNRRWAGSFGYYLSDFSELELSMIDSYNRSYFPGFEDTTFHSQVYSLDWVQSFLPKGSIFQPYLKLGVGELNQTASGSYYGGLEPPAELDSLTIVIGVGARLRLFGDFGLKGEATTYLAGGVLSTWQNNYALSIGFSLYL